MVTSKQTALDTVRSAPLSTPQQQLVERVESAIKLATNEPLRIRIFLRGENRPMVVQPVRELYEREGWHVDIEPALGGTGGDSLLLW